MGLNAALDLALLFGGGPQPFAQQERCSHHERRNRHRQQCEPAIELRHEKNHDAHSQERMARRKEQRIDDLEQQIGISKGREHQTKLGVAQAEFFLNFAGGRADVDPVDIGNEVHDAEHRQHDMGGLEPKPHPLPHEFAVIGFTDGADPPALTAPDASVFRPRFTLSRFKS